MAVTLGARATNAEYLRLVLDDPRTYQNREGLLMVLTLAVEYQHEGAAATIAEYIAKPLVDAELLDLIDRLRMDTCPPWTHNLNEKRAMRLLGLIEKAKAQYATCLRAKDKRDVKILWPYESNLKTITQTRDDWLFLKGLLRRRYGEHASPPDEIGAHKGFSVVMDNHDFERLCQRPLGLLLHCEENVSPMFHRSKLTSKPRSLAQIHLQMAQQLHEIHQMRYSAATAPTKGENQTWYPFPNVVRKTNEHAALPLEEKYRRMDLLKEWDSSLEPHKLFTCSKTYPATADRQDSRFPRHWSSEDNVRDDRWGAKAGEHGSAASKTQIAVQPKLPNYGFDVRKPRGPPVEYQCKTSSPSSGSVNSVVIASLSTVAGTIQQMKSFVRKPSKGDAIPVVVDERLVDCNPGERAPPPVTPLTPISEVPSDSNVIETHSPCSSQQPKSDVPRQQSDPCGHPDTRTSTTTKPSTKFRRRASLGSKKVKVNTWQARRPSLRTIPSHSHLPKASTSTFDFAPPPKTTHNIARQDSGSVDGASDSGEDENPATPADHHVSPSRARTQPRPPAPAEKVAVVPSSTYSFARAAAAAGVPIPGKTPPTAASRKDSGLGSISPSTTTALKPFPRETQSAQPDTGNAEQRDDLDCCARWEGRGWCQGDVEQEEREEARAASTTTKTKTAPAAPPATMASSEAPSPPKTVPLMPQSRPSIVEVLGGGAASSQNVHRW
ncbi:hypothetical protein K490DRAFT_56277 [Saccharata proteae CBS 121410]|uniref:Uncharacterized protein n=1 Tax=Saccharata proteae CBS 121410 TaxID=1314787 RepID=A0A9P4HXH5_9PEZI|nr:hypothetical protein K490DRAFT_56277 [Saccharata proteae CBS 121410]